MGGSGDDDGTWYARYVNTLSRHTERGGQLEPRHFRNGYLFKKHFKVSTYVLRSCTWITPEVLDDANTSLLDMPGYIHYSVMGSTHQVPRFLENYALRKICVVDATGRKHMSTQKSLMDALQVLGVETEEWIWCLRQVALNRMGKPSALDKKSGGEKSSDSAGGGTGSRGEKSSNSGGGGTGSGGAGSSNSAGSSTGSRSEKSSNSDFDLLAKLMETNMPLDPVSFPRENLEVNSEHVDITQLAHMNSKKWEEMRCDPLFYDFPSRYNTNPVVKDYNLGKMYGIRMDGKKVMVSRTGMKNRLKTVRLQGNKIGVERWLAYLSGAMKIMEASAVAGKRRRATEGGEAAKKKKHKDASASNGSAVATAPDAAADEGGGGGGGAPSSDEDTLSQCSTVGSGGGDDVAAGGGSGAGVMDGGGDGAVHSGKGKRPARFASDQEDTA